jgi:hypothetical protein
MNIPYKQMFTGIAGVFNNGTERPFVINKQGY